MASSQERLDSWKEISQYLKRDERTVRRWEQERNLPVHRTPGSKRGNVFAYPEELDQWLLQSTHSDLRNGSQKAADTETGATEDAEQEQNNNWNEEDSSDLQPTEQKTAAPGRRRSLLLLAAAVVLLCAAFGLGYRIAHSHPATCDISIQQLTFQHGIVRAARFRPDGRNIVYAAAWRGSPLGLYESSLDRPESEAIHAPDSSSPQSELLAVSSTSKLALLLNPSFRNDAQTGMLAVQGLYESRPETVSANVTSADWSPDGSTLAYTVYDEKSGPVIHTYSLQRHEDRIVYPAPNTVVGWFAGIRYSPHGGLLAFERHRPDGQGNVVILDPVKKTTITSALYRDLVGLAWRPDGKEVWFTAAPSGISRDIRAMDAAGRERLVYAAPVQLTLQDISSRGDLLVLRNLDSSSIFVGQMRGQAESSEISGLDRPLLGDISNDGKQIVFEESGSALPRPALYIRSDTDAQIKPLGEAALPASITPDGSAVLALTNEPCARVVMFTPDKPSRILTRSDLCVAWVSWMPKGQRFMFVGAGREQHNRCYVQSVDGSGLKPISGENARCGLVSPDGKYALVNYGDDYYKVAIDAPEPPVKVRCPAHYVPVHWIAGDRIDAIKEYGFSDIDTINIATGEMVEKYPVRMPSDVESVSFLKIGADHNTYAYSANQRSSDLFVIKGLQ